MIKCKEISVLGEEWNGDARLYELSKPIKYVTSETKYVIISSIVTMMGLKETVIFPSNYSGVALSAIPIKGSIPNTLSHNDAIELAGWELIK